MAQYTGLISIILMVGVFYLMIFIPEKRRKKKYTEMISSLKVNDEIITKGGIMGKIINIGEDYIVIQSGPDKARLKIVKDAILSVVAKDTTVEIENKLEK